ncbi:pentatricopeptide repeat-containing protein At5g02830, chloroplastic isoform X2 [Malania oleifera]|uniref:pentatricopeptide repeat-containing protein At5g02830, chloroplastic isoform X2 n=1 Tax=Malania oleifera TaxID=397392 RepID=UPI0025AE6139|nr:pentatricopeptide repeat-containing protein At5g02830, chloroplastic isoform X2 [Malania oleifera]
MRELVTVSSSTLFPPSPCPPHHRRRCRHHNRQCAPKSPIPEPVKPSHSKSPPKSAPSSSAVSVPLPLTAVQRDLVSRRHTRLSYYADLASKRAGDGRLEDFLMIAESVIDSGAEPQKLVALLNVELVSAGISGMIRCEGKLRTVLEVLSSAEKLGISPLVLLDGVAKESVATECRRIVGSRNVAEAVDLMEILAGFGFSIKELVEPLYVIKVCVEKQDPSIAIRFCRYACILPHAHVVLCTIIHEFGKKKALVSALTVFEASKQKLGGPNMYACRMIIDVCGLCGDYIKSRDIYEELLAQKFTPNIYVLNSLMNVNAHDLTYALHVCRHMKHLGVTPDVASYNILLKACCLAGRVDLAQNIYREVQHLESTGALKLDVFTYSTIIKVFTDAKLWHMALKIKEDMISSGITPNTVAWSSLISTCANAGLVEQAFLLFKEMLLAGCEPNSQCCNILLHACVEACQYDRAFRFFHSWKTTGLQEVFGDDFNRPNDTRDNFVGMGHASENSSTSMINDTSNSHCTNFTKKLPFTPTTATYNILMKACGTDYCHAKSLMDEMKKVGLSPNHISWSILIDICGRSGNVEAAIQILKSMREAGIKSDVIAYTTAIKVCVESKNLKIAFSLFSEMKRYHIRPNLVTYNTLLRAHSRYGSLHEVQQCLAVYQDMHKAGYKSNDYYLKELIEEWCEGVIQDNNQNQGQSSSFNRPSFNRPHSGRSQILLLEKVAAHLQKDMADNLVVDLQGLTQIEARIVVLAVLRMIKEKYSLGDLVNDDLLIIIGVGEVSLGTNAHTAAGKNAIIKLLQNELRLEVLSAVPQIELNNNMDLGSCLDSDADLGIKRLPTELEFSARRPAVLERLKVTKESLYRWLQRRVGTIKR